RVSHVNGQDGLASTSTGRFYVIGGFSLDDGRGGQAPTPTGRGNTRMDPSATVHVVAHTFYSTFHFGIWSSYFYNRMPFLAPTTVIGSGPNLCLKRLSARQRRIV